ncbi:cyclic nucleotide-binding domain-containing protein [Actinomadura gamaensis]|uniref:Cyclic nucleotide-binding domain-containing protein n=1 Tax=Actinomadura gamaensis TaxID=1763541 RepID=A0ABV9UD17_9ACTN
MTKFPERHNPYDPDATPDPGDEADQPPDEVTRRDRPARDRHVPDRNTPDRHTPDRHAPDRHTPNRQTSDRHAADRHVPDGTRSHRRREAELLAPTQPMPWPPGDDDGVVAPPRPLPSGAGRRPGAGGTGSPNRRDRPPVARAGSERAPGRTVEGAARPGVPRKPGIRATANGTGIPVSPDGHPAGPGFPQRPGDGGVPVLPDRFQAPVLPEPEGWPPAGARGPGGADGAAASTDFWSALTSVERMQFLRSAEQEVLPAGHVLWREHDLADHVAVIWSGKVTIRVNQNGVERIVAVRGPGDLIGERAALLVRTRSATVVALDRLTILRMPVGEFAAFLSAYPRVLAVLDQQMYARLTQAPDDGRGAVPDEAAVVSSAAAVWEPPRPAVRRAAHDWAGQVCSIMFVDVVGFSAAHRNDTDRLELRRVLYEAVPEALEGSNVPWAACYHEDRGDGMLIVVPPQAPPARVVDPMLSLLTARLRRHNHAASEAMRLRIRMSLHIGPVMPDREGVNGAAIIQAARLLDAPELRHRMSDTDADVGFVASDYVFENVLAQGPGYINPRSFQRIRFRAKNAAYTGWMHLSQGTF